jgi:hypothetical protein
MYAQNTTVFEKNIPKFCRKYGFLSFLCNKMQGKGTCPLIFCFVGTVPPLFMAQQKRPASFQKPVQR